MDKSQSPACRDVADHVLAERSRGQIRSVAFRIEDTVYVGRPGETHACLYTRLLLKRIVHTKRPDLWTALESDHGFLTTTGCFLTRTEAFEQFGLRRSQDLADRQAPQGEGT